MEPIVVALESWEDYKQRMTGYAALRPRRRAQFMFRGHGDSRWPLRTTLDRDGAFDSAEDREDRVADLLREFKRESYGLHSVTPTSDLEWELLGRHHGLKTPILDWTQSPFIAAFFAFSDMAPGAERVAVWVLDRERFRQDDVSEVRVIDDEEAIRFNPRAIEQRGLFLRIGGVERSLEELVGPALWRFEIPASEQRIALTELDEMLLNARVLFRDFGGAAATANQRVLLLGGEPA